MTPYRKLWTQDDPSAATLCVKRAPRTLASAGLGHPFAQRIKGAKEGETFVSARRTFQTPATLTSVARIVKQKIHNSENRGTG